MIDQSEMILDHFPGNFLLSCTSIADHETISQHIILCSKSVQSSQFP